MVSVYTLRVGVIWKNATRNADNALDASLLSAVFLTRC